MMGLFSGGDDNDGGSAFTLTDVETNTITWVDQPFTLEGDIAGGGPSELIPDELAPFTVNDTVSQIKVVLSWDPQSMDLDLEVLDASDKVAGSSGNAPGEPETVEIKKRIKPGEWKAKIDPFFAANVHYIVEITFTHEMEIGSSEGNASSGAIMHQKIEECSGKTDSGTTEFDPGVGYESLLIQFSAQSASGEISVSIEQVGSNISQLSEFMELLMDHPSHIIQYHINRKQIKIRIAINGSLL